MHKNILIIIFITFGMMLVNITFVQSQIDTKILIEQLNDENWSIRAKAVEALGESKEASAVEVLIKALNDINPFVRLRGIEALGKIKDKKAVKPLINALNDSNLNNHKAAVEALGEIGDVKALEPLIEEMKYNQSEIRIRAVTSIAKIKSPRVVEIMITALQDENIDIRCEAAYSLGEIKDVRAVDFLINALKDESEYVRCESAKALGNIGDNKVAGPLTLLIKDSNNDVSNEAISALLKIPGLKIRPLIEKLYDNKIKDEIKGILFLIENPESESSINALIEKLYDDRLKNEIKESLILIGKPAVEPLKKGLNNKNYRIREASADILIKLKYKPGNIDEKISYLTAKRDWDECVKIGKEAVPRLIKIISGYEIVENEAIKALGKIGLDAFEPTLNAFREGKLADETVSEIFAEIGKPAIKPLMDLYNGKESVYSRDEYIARISINKIKDETIVDHLNEIYKKEGGLDFEAIEILGEIGGDKAKELLLKELDGYILGAKSAALSLDKIGWKPESISEKVAYYYAKGEWEKCIELGEDALPILKNKIIKYGASTYFKDMLCSDKDKMRLLAVEILDVDQNNNELWRYELNILTGDDNEEIRSKALKVLTEMDSRKIEYRFSEPSKEDLQKIFSPPIDYRNEQISRIEYIRNPNLVQPLIKLLKEDFDNNIKIKVIHALANIGDSSAVQPLKEMLKIGDINLQREVVNALVMLKWVPSNDEEKAAYYLSAEYRNKEIAEAEKLKNKANKLFAEEKYEDAIQYGEKALNILGKHYRFKTAVDEISVLIECYIITGRYKEAESIYKRYLECLNDQVNLYYKEATLLKLAEIYVKTGRYEEAEPILLNYKKKNESDIWVNRNLSLLYGGTGRHLLAHKCFKLLINKRERDIENVFKQFSEKQKTGYIDSIIFDMNYFLSHIVQYQSKDVNSVREGLDTWLKWKGMVTESQSRYEDLFLYDGNPRVIIDYYRLIEIKREIVKHAFSGIVDKNGEEYKQKLSILEKEKETIEAGLSEMSKDYAIEKRFGKIDSKIVAKLLPKGSYLIEFACPDFYNFKDRKWEGSHYLAFILSPDERKPVGLVDIGKTDNINKLIEEYRMKAKGIAEEEKQVRKTDGLGNRELRNVKIEEVLKENKKGRDEIARKLYDAIFSPLEEFLADGENIFISPEGNLNFLPFEVLIASDGKYLIDKYQFNYITTGRDIMQFYSGFETSNNEIIIMADPDFDLGKYEKDALLSKTDTAEEKTEENIQYSREMRGINFGRLSGTREEGESIIRILKEKYGEKAKLYLGDQALEGILYDKKVPKILHIASHGFFLIDDMADMLSGSIPESTQGLSDEEMRNILITEDKQDKRLPKFGNPMLRSGIALSGANTSLEKGRDKGILVAEKISGLRLRGTELVVLSACDTGVGEVKKGEGVFGLKRAFILAGAKTLVMSLWKVPDEETKELMIEFYKRMADGKGKAEALREAKLKIKEKNPNPFYWGGFVAIGDPN